MAVYSRYARVVEADGKPMTVRTALQLINQALDEVLAEQEGEFDADTRWAIIWFEQSAHHPPFDEPETFHAVLIDQVLPVMQAPTPTCPAARGRPSSTSTSPSFPGWRGGRGRSR